MKLESTLTARMRDVENARAVRGVVKRVDAAKRGNLRSLDAIVRKMLFCSGVVRSFVSKMMSKREGIGL
jgi:hypothetical protein